MYPATKLLPTAPSPFIWIIWFLLGWRGSHMEPESRPITTRTLQSIDNEHIRRLLDHLELLPSLMASVRSFARYLNSSWILNITSAKKLSGNQSIWRKRIPQTLYSRNFRSPPCLWEDRLLPRWWSRPSMDGYWTSYAWPLLHYERADPIIANFSTLCDITADASGMTKVPKLGINEKYYWQQDYSIILLFGLTELKAQISWMEDVRLYFSDRCAALLMSMVL